MNDVIANKSINTMGFDDTQVRVEHNPCYTE